MKFLIITILVLAVGITPAFAYSENALQDTVLNADSATVSLDITFGQDTIKQLLTKTVITNNLEDITLTFYGDEIILTEPELKVANDGNHFRISSLPDGIIMYGHKNMDVGNYQINIYLASDNGLTKFVVASDAQLDDDVVIEPEIIPDDTPYIPELTINYSHDFTTYWKDVFNFDVQAYDKRINPDATGFEGKLDGVDITVIISSNDGVLTTLKGITEYGTWSGEHFIQENLVNPNEYTVDILASYLNQTVSKSSSMFVIGTVVSSDSSNHTPIAIASADDTTPTHPALVTLDASASSDPDGDTITYSWVQTSGVTQILSDSTAESPTFTTTGTGTFVFQLTVSDGKKSDSDLVTITVS